MYAHIYVYMYTHIYPNKIYNIQLTDAACLKEGFTQRKGERTHSAVC